MNEERRQTQRTAQAPRGRLIGLVRQMLGQRAGSRLLRIDARLNDLGMSSIKMVGLMLAVEAEFNITIPQSEITPENFDSISTIEAMVLRLMDSSSRL
jgi:acyl carrier protein